ncbi:MAG: PD-(D/E)XK nuclease family transposase [Tannerella sp.]|jgi:predicted transposase/invertase (TIGR01784 family)|nr:PD-(D/E)XK nuclease family transposase [Tannerella sp.]
MYGKLATEEKSFVRFDWAMKRLLCSKADYVVPEGFLTVLLGENVKIVGIGEREDHGTKADEMDILAENDAKEPFIIEIQHCHLADYFHQTYFGVSKPVTGRIKIGQDYTYVRKVYHIDIVYFKLDRGEDYVYHGGVPYRGIHHGDELQLTPGQRAFFTRQTSPGLSAEYYILKVKDFDGYAKDRLDEWIYYLKNDAIPESFTAPGLREARERLPVDNLSRSEWAAYEAQLMQYSHEYSILQTAMDEGLTQGRAEGHAKGLTESLAKGLAEGYAKGLAEDEEEQKKLQEAMEIKAKALAQKDSIIANAVKNLTAQGMSPQQIAQILQSDVEEVRKNI